MRSVIYFIINTLILSGIVYMMMYAILMDY